MLWEIVSRTRLVFKQDFCLLVQFCEIAKRKE